MGVKEKGGLSRPEISEYCFNSFPVKLCSLSFPLPSFPSFFFIFFLLFFPSSSFSLLFPPFFLFSPSFSPFPFLFPLQLSLPFPFFFLYPSFFLVGKVVDFPAGWLQGAPVPLGTTWLGGEEKLGDCTSLLLSSHSKRAIHKSAVSPAKKSSCCPLLTKNFTQLSNFLWYYIEWFQYK